MPYRSRWWQGGAVWKKPVSLSWGKEGIGWGPEPPGACGSLEGEKHLVQPMWKTNIHQGEVREIDAPAYLAHILASVSVGASGPTHGQWWHQPPKQAPRKEPDARQQQGTS